MNCRTAVVALVHEHSRVLSGLHRTAIDRPEHDLVAAAGIKPDRVFTDTASGRAGSDRPGWTECMGWLREGDHVVVVAVDRFGRSVREVGTALHELTTRGVTCGRCAKGWTRAPRRGARSPASWPPSPSWNSNWAKSAGPAQQKKLLRLYRQGEPVSELITIFGISRTLLFRTLKVLKQGSGAFEHKFCGDDRSPRIGPR
jgi:DNA invertase Pin-like site-specific DNA recombinase